MKLDGRQFGEQVRHFQREAERRLDLTRRAAALEAFSLVIDRSPVDTGRFRGNWQTTLQRPAQSSTERTDPSGAMAKAEAEAMVERSRDDNAVYLSNLLPYAVPLEYGWSAQAKHGMVRRTAAQWHDIVASKFRYYMNNG